jgi:branched-chain amino acid transport system substrate-binding protein
MAIRIWTARCRLLAVFLLLTGLVACAKKPIVTEEEIKAARGDTLFLKAENSFEEGADDEAMALYRDYLQMYPESPLVPAVLMKLGEIETAQGDYPGAQKSYTRVVCEHPDSRFAPRAQLAVLFLIFAEEQYFAALEYADTIDDNKLDPEGRAKKYHLVGDSYRFAGEFSISAEVYLQLYLMGSEDEKEAVVQKVTVVMTEMTAEEAAGLVDGLDIPELRGLLTLQLAEKYVADDRLDEAFATLSTFVRDYPDDDRVAEAFLLIDSFHAASLYNHHTIGCLLPLSGRYESFGNKALRGVELALGRFVDSHPNTEVTLVVRDTAADPLKAVDAFRELVAEEQVAAVIGPLVTAPAVALEAQREGVPIITFTQKKGVVDTGDYVFRNYLTPEMQVKALLSHAFDHRDYHRFAILYPRERYGETFMNLFWNEVVERGGEVVGVESYGVDQSDFADAIKKLVGLHYELPKELEPEILPEDGDPRQDGALEPEPIVDFDAVFIPDGPEKGGLILPQLVYYDVLDMGIYGTNLWHSDKLVEISEGYGQGAVMPDLFFSGSDKPVVVQFVRDFESIYGESPGALAAVAYDTALILFETVSRPEIQFRSGVKHGLVDLPEFSGVTGSTGFDAGGEARKELFLLEIAGKQFVEIADGPAGPDVEERQ